jgi:FkbM family methyltransferase
MDTWITLFTGNNDPRYAVLYDGSNVTANDGDVCISFVTYDYLKEIPNPYCLDIGADQCWWSIFCCRCNPTATVDAFEPKIPSDELQTSLTTYYPSLRLHSYAISDVEGCLPFTNLGSDSHSRIPSDISVPCAPLTPFLEKCKRVDLIKMDTEGHELPILRSLIPFCSKVGAILFECSIYWYGSTQKEAMDTTMDVFLKLRKTHPYTYVLSRRGEPILYDISDDETLVAYLLFSYIYKEQFDCLLTSTPFSFSTPFPTQ